MVSGISSSVPTLAVPTRAPANNPLVATQIAGADRALNVLINDPGLLQSLSQVTSTYIPPSFGQIQSLLWGVMNANGGATVTKTELEKAVILDGGARVDADALWTQLNAGVSNPNSPANGVTSLSFVANAYLTAAILSNVGSVQDSIFQSQVQAQADATNGSSILGYIYGGGSSGSNLNVLS